MYDHNTQKHADAKEQLYLAMEFIDGRTVDHVVGDADGLSLEDAIALVLDICDTIRIGHAEDVLHRDLKPDNLIIREKIEGKPEVYIVDYGLSFNSKGEDKVTHTDETFRSIFLALPETNTPGGDHRDPRSDVAAICGVLYFCLTTHRPGHLRDAKDLPPHHRAGFSIRERFPDDYRVSRLETLLDRGFAYNPDSRIQTVTELIERLQAILATAPSRPTNPEVVAQDAEKLFSVHDPQHLMEEFRNSAAELNRTIKGHVAKLN